MNFTRERLNPIEFIKNWFPEADISHITYDPNIKAGDRDYWLIRESGGDGLYMYTVQMLQKAVLPLINKSTYDNTVLVEQLENVKDVKYTIGDMWHSTVFGMIYLQCSKTKKYPGQHERVRIPVKCELIF